MKVKILGNNSALPAHDRYPTCQVVEIEGVYILVDCGEGAQVLLRKHHISWNRIRHIFISHLHGDHYFGLPGLIHSMSLMGRTQPLTVYAPVELASILEQIERVAGTVFSFPFEFVAIESDAGLLYEDTHLRLEHFPVEHRIFCHGLVVTERSNGLKLIPERCRYYEIPSGYYKALKSGADYLRKDDFLVKNEWVTAPGKPDRKYAYCADTVFTTSFIEFIMGVDILYHESTYLKGDEDRALLRFHSTAEQAAIIAKKAEAKQLVIGHYSSRYKEVSAFELEAQQLFPNSKASVEGDEFEC
jgi:ribonuclease Z